MKIKSQSDIAKYFTFRLYFHWALAHANKLACSRNILPYHTLTLVISTILIYSNYIYILYIMCVYNSLIGTGEHHKFVG